MEKTGITLTGTEPAHVTDQRFIFSAEPSHSRVHLRIRQNDAIRTVSDVAFSNLGMTGCCTNTGTATYLARADAASTVGSIVWLAGMMYLYILHI